MGLGTFAKEGLPVPNKILITKSQEHAYFLIWDENTRSFFGWGVKDLEEDDFESRLVDLEDFSKQILALPPKLNEVSFAQKSTETNYVQLKPLEDVELPQIEIKEEGTKIPLTNAKDMIINIFSLLDKRIPQLYKIFYLADAENHRFFAFDNRKKMGFSIKNNSESDRNNMGIFNPILLASLALKMTAKSKVFFSHESNVFFSIEQKSKIMVLGALANEIPKKITEKIAVWEKKENTIKFKLEDFWDLYYFHRKKATEIGQKIGSYYMFFLEKKGDYLIDPLTKKKTKLIEATENDYNLSIPLSEIASLLTIMEEGKKGIVEINVSNPEKIEGGSPYSITYHKPDNLVSQNWVIPKVVINNKRISQITKEIANNRKRNKEETIKISIEKGGVTNTFVFRESDDGLLVYVDFQGIVVQTMNSLESKTKKQEKELVTA